jgi:SAM-dependent methyltransferase
MPARGNQFIARRLVAKLRKVEEVLGDRLDYHRKELALAYDKTHPAHSLPIVPLGTRRILDIGCGMGQTLMALQLDPGVEAWGLDHDLETVTAGRQMVSSNVHLVVGAGELLPFLDKSFDLVFSRVALPYMDLRASLSEVARVLCPEGRFWAALHPPSVLLRRIGEDVSSGRGRDLMFCGFVAMNSVLLRVARRQLRVRGHCETVQTKAGVAALLRQHRLELLQFTSRPGQLVVEAQKQE